MFLDPQDVRRAFAEDEFFPVFQPRVELLTGQLAGFEVLARWNHARLGAVPPDAFIPIVQTHGFINTLTQKLLAKIFAAAPLLSGSLGLSIKISPLQLLDMTIPAHIAEAAARGGFPLDRLTIEITESALFEDLPLAQSVAGELKALHCKLCLDDFGKERSRLLHLQDLPFDELKVDRYFVNAITQNRACQTIVAAVVGLGRSLGLVTVAEGVETVTQAGIMCEMGCNLAQGWHFGKPAHADEIPRMLSATFAVCAPL
jgi:EAL domain-containing protein (putative c-di-GMP-specific phosphodiesterase class I)